MKEIGVAILFFISLILLSFGIDYLQGFDSFQSEFHHVFNPFSVMAFPELFLLYTLTFGYIVQRIIASFSMRRKNSSQGQQPGMKQNDSGNSQNNNP